MINVALAVVKTFKSKKSKDIWTLWLEEIKSFSELPQFFNYFSQDLDKAQTIYKLIDSEYDIDPSLNDAAKDNLSKDFEKLYTENVKYTYKIIDEIFKNHTTKQLLDTCIENGTFNKFLDRLSQLTGEVKRSKRTIPENGEIATDAQIDIQNEPNQNEKSSSK